jgi:hypothetical protein
MNVKRRVASKTARVLAELPFSTVEAVYRVELDVISAII